MSPRCLAAIAAVSSLLALASPCRAGSGKIEGGKVDLSVMFTYPETDPDRWLPFFEESSQLLYNATNGQLQLGTIRVLNGGFDKSGADIWIMNNNSGAFANPGALGGAGHIYMSQVHASTSGGALGQFGLVHEFGHYGFGLFDEYKGVVEAALTKVAEQTAGFSEPNQFCAGESDPTACIMDGGTTVSPNNGRTEFCTGAAGGLSSAHNEGLVVGGQRYVNSQQAINGASCWETIANAAGLQAPAAVETSDPPGLDAVDWQVVADLDRIVLCVDRSESMGGAKLELAREAAARLVDLVHPRQTIEVGGQNVTFPGEEIAVISFADAATVEFPIQETLDENTKTAAIASLGPITSGGFSNIGTALETAFEQITSRGPVPGLSEAIVFISDGVHNTGIDPATIVPGVAERGVKVFVIGVGLDAGVDFLKSLAQDTGGLYFFAATESDLGDIYSAIASAVRGGAAILDTSGQVFGSPQCHTVLVDPYTGELTSVLRWDTGGLGMEMTSPSGDVITPASAGARDDVDAVVRSSFLYLRITAPESGTWQICVVPESLTVPSNYELETFVEDRSVSVVARTDAPVYTYPGPIVVRTDVSAVVPVAGAEVTAMVERPGGTSVPITLFDDGSPLHADAFANDGSYSATFADFTGEGTYAFHVKVTNTVGTGPDPSLPFVEDGGDPTPIVIAPFVRYADVSADVVDFPLPLAGSLVFEPRTLNLQSHGQFVTCFIELPAGYAAGDIDPSTVALEGVLPALPHPTAIGDHDDDGIEDLMVKFDRAAVIALFQPSVRVPVRVTGSLENGAFFAGEDVISVVDPDASAITQLSAPAGVVGSPLGISWPAPEGQHSGLQYYGYVSTDGGAVWHEVFKDLVGTTAFEWSVDVAATAGAVVMVEARDAEGFVRMGASATFPIYADDPTPVGDGGTIGTRASTEFLGVSSNPAKPGVVLSYSLAAGGEVRLAIYDVQGRVVRRLASGHGSAGVHRQAWDGDDEQGRPVPSGQYLYVFEAGANRASGKIALVR